MSKDIDDDARIFQHADVEDKIEIATGVESLEDSNQVNFITDSGKDEFIDESYENKGSAGTSITVDDDDHSDLKRLRLLLLPNAPEN